MVKAEPGAQKSEEHEYKPKYVALPQQRERGHGRRNMLTGVALFCAAGVLFAWAVYLAGGKAVLTLGACLATAMLLYIMARSRLFRQRNGGFVGWAAVSLLSMILVIAHEGWRLATSGAPKANPSAAVTPAPTSAPPGTTVAPSLPLLRDAFVSAQAAPNSGPTVRITRDVTVSVEGKQYLAKRDEFYPLANVKSDELVLLIGDREASIPTQAGEISDEEPLGDNARTAAPSRAGEPREEAELEPDATSPVMTESDAQREAIRRYPNLGIAGTVENRLFITAIKEQRSTGEVDFFKDPRWPITLAELLAEQEGWRRADTGRPPAIIDEDSPAPMAPTAPASSASGSRGTSGSRR